MKDFVCKKCGNTTYIVQEKSNGTGLATGLYCAKCGTWHKWLNKQEKILYTTQSAEIDKDAEIARLTEENAELKARLDKAVELPFFQKDGAVIVLIYKNKDGIVLIEKYIEDEYYNGKRGKEAAEARLAELKGGEGE